MLQQKQEKREDLVLNRLELDRYCDVEYLDRKLDELVGFTMMKRSEIWLASIREKQDGNTMNTEILADMSHSVTNLLLEKIKELNDQAIHFASEIMRRGMGT
jgi:hypothetical protein